MKKILYLCTMLFNALGSILSMSLFAYAASFCFENLFLVLSGCVVFIVSFTITVIDYNNVFKKERLVYVNILKAHHNKNEVIINDYKDYFVSKKSDFIIA